MAQPRSGDMRPIVLRTPATIDPADRGVRSVRTDALSHKIEWLAEGLTTTSGTHTDLDGVVHEWHEITHVEQAPPRLFSQAQFRRPIVVPINGRRYVVSIKIDSESDWDNDERGTPVGAEVTFTPTDAPETPFKSWDAVAALREALESLRTDRAEMVAYSASDPTWAAEEVARLDKRIVALESGEETLRPHAYARFFGVPDFIQNGIFPALDGVAAQCLVTLETEWGDCGNVNILFSCDEAGVPCRAWFEASCC